MKNQKWLIVSHDAGGAEIISAWVRRQKGIEFNYLLGGPAEKIFKGKLTGIQNLQEMVFDKINDYDFILTGTSWASDLEKIAIKKAKESGTNVASYIDHWVNYEERFFLDGKKILPDEIWLGDEEGIKIAAKIFPEIKLILVPNVYFEDIKIEINKIETRGKKDSYLHILYVAEPIADQSIIYYGNSDHWGYTEFQAMDLFFIHYSELNIKAKIRLRLHPSEADGKYHNILKKFPDIFIKISKNNTLIEDCAWADWVVGCQSMAMVIALFGGREVYTSIPEKGSACGLPFKQIKKFNLS